MGEGDLLCLSSFRTLSEVPTSFQGTDQQTHRKWGWRHRSPSQSLTPPAPEALSSLLRHTSTHPRMRSQVRSGFVCLGCFALVFRHLLLRWSPQCPFLVTSGKDVAVTPVDREGGCSVSTVQVLPSHTLDLKLFPAPTVPTSRKSLVVPALWLFCHYLDEQGARA